MLYDQLFKVYDPEKKKGNLIMKSITSPIVSISCRPNSNIMAIACENGEIYEWNFIEKPPIMEPFKSHEFEIFRDA